MVALNPSVVAGLSVFARQGFNLVQNITFDGAAGQSVDTAQWNFITEYDPPLVLNTLPIFLKTAF
jgi:hypothetical protein